MVERDHRSHYYFNMGLIKNIAATLAPLVMLSWISVYPASAAETRDIFSRAE
jgi:hypothetical protein